MNSLIENKPKVKKKNHTTTYNILNLKNTCENEKSSWKLYKVWYHFKNQTVYFYDETTLKFHGNNKSQFNLIVTT